MATTHSPIGLETEHLAAMREEYDSDSRNRLMQNAITIHDVDEVALDRNIVTAANHTYSTVLDDWSPTNQGASGRCWLFSGLNLCRFDTMDKMNVKQFEFSQSYMMFWDKVERANFVLETVIETADRPADDRVIQYLMGAPIEDAGQWDMFVNLVKKHGVVPKSAMPETQSSGATRKMNGILYYQVRQGAAKIRDLYKQESGLDAMRQAKLDTLKVVYKILAIHLGTPPESFDWQWKDRDGEFRRDGEMTPHDFASKYIATNLDELVCLVHDPREGHPIGRTYTIAHLGNVVGGSDVKYLNISIETMKEITMGLLQDGRPVWMGCDTGKQYHGKLGLWDANLFDYDGVYGTDFGMDKAARLEYGQTQMTHAMLFTGVDVVDGKPRRWRVENSYGDTAGDKGFFLMNDSWFEQHMFEIAAPKSRLTPELQAALDTEPIVLPPWDPMGALAGR
ncbi:MAG: C1 family peptidase [SAR202 cluster bacterium]|jgi:bleomycin hydrolase|nr:C1 family peptidase [SAR202 cluster bacterium]MDP6302337.1 C1 family peptidase [SAR202 cluster bacterium]MDP7226343.1 C1 family peptidase [SAR202 cluster bacterium]HJO82437.1 C1 family peptidase [SAR202 cluster bacterium]|tara:strand:+ start:2378 stop:3730 length:1353 start_codon:yes stop_codon:yes gene_type:complete